MKEDKYNLAFTSDLLIFGIDSRLTNNTRSLPKKYFSILLVKRDKEPDMNKWCLPGGFVDNKETSKEASFRILKKETSLSDVYMQQLMINDDIDRDPRGRTISISYLSLVDRSKISEVLSENACWFDISITEDNNIINIQLSNGEEVLDYKIKRIPIDIKTDEFEYEMIDKNVLAFDHEKIIAAGIMGLRNKALKTDIVFNLMPDLFTIGELKQVYEVILGKSLVNSAFRRTIADKIELTNEIVKTGGHRPSQLCRYKGDK